MFKYVVYLLFYSLIVLIAFIFSLECTLSVHKLTPGQQAWLGAFSIRMVMLTSEQQLELNKLKSCAHYASSNKADGNASLYPSPKSALVCLKAEALAKEISPLHKHEDRAGVWKSISSLRSPFPTVNGLRWYLGDALGFYFAWLHYYFLALFALSGLGLVTWIAIAVSNCFAVEAMDSELSQLVRPPLSPFRFYYGMATIIWALGCVKMWRRQRSQLAEDWCCPVLKSAADFTWMHNPNDLRPEFKGTLIKSPITGEMELHFPAIKRRVLYVLTGGITILCVLLAVFVNVLLMNLEVYLFFDSVQNIV